MFPPEPLAGLAPAKINLVLEVTGRRRDGYHEIDTVLQTLALADEVQVRFGGPPGVSVSGPFASGTPADESNLAWRAAATLGHLTGQQVDGLAIHLEKRIPAAGGLGGGASDAATVLRLLQGAWPGTTDALLFQAASATGSDEAFFLCGGTARAQGRGEQVTPLSPLPPSGVVLFVPPTTIERKTARLFAALAETPFDSGPASARFAGGAGQPYPSGQVFNAFDRVAFDVFPGLAALRDEIQARTAAIVHLAGAGPTLFWIGPPHQAPGIASAAAGLPCTVIETATAGSLWRP